MRLNGTVFIACVIVLWPRNARAVRYEVFIDIETEEDLYDLYVTAQISEASFDGLLFLLQRPIDLNQATREELYRLPNIDYDGVDRILSHREASGAIRSLAELANAGVLEKERASSLRPFVTLIEPESEGGGVTGFLRTQLGWTGRHDRLPPPLALQARLRALRSLEAGVVGALLRNRVRGPQWDPFRRGLSVAPEATRFLVPKAYLGWAGPRFGLVVGTYRIGFGQRLTFDVTGQVTPNGIIPDGELRRESELSLRCRRGPGELGTSPCLGDRQLRVTPDFTWTNRLTGIGLGMTRLPLGQGWLQGYVWASYQLHRVRASDITLDGCPDPRRDDDPRCAGPTVFVRQHDSREASPTFPRATLPAAVGEALGGAHLGYFWSERRHIGVTGYGALPHWRIDGVALDFQENARTPFGGAFGAVGVDTAFGFRRQDFFAELSRSFDHQGAGGGGIAAIVRSVTTIPAGEIDLSVRYYAPRFANPYARPPSAPDEYEGLAARDETGARARVALEVGPNVTLRCLADLWWRSTRAALGMRMFARIDARMSTAWSSALWVEHTKASQKTSSAVLVSFAAQRKLELSWQLQHRSSDASLAERRRQHDLGVLLRLTAAPATWLRLRFRGRYDHEDLAERVRLSRAIFGSFDVSFRFRERDGLRLRYDVRAHLDRRSSTQRRAPNPEHWLWVEHVVRF